MTVEHQDGSADPASGAMSRTLSRPDCESAGLQATFIRSLSVGGWVEPGSDRLIAVLIDLHDWQPWLPDALRLLDPAEAGRVQRRYIEADRRALTLTYALHRLLLAQLLDVVPRAVPLGRDWRGCPRLDLGRGREVFTSLSHSGRFSALAVSTAGVVGVDIEPIGRASALPEIAASVCSLEEADSLRDTVEPGYSAALLALWVRKEALLKAAGTGLAQEMAGFSAPVGETLPLPLRDGRVEIRMLDPGGPCVAAIAGAPGARVSSGWLRPWLP